MSLGEYRVGIDFNPSGDDRVGQIKRRAADLIDYLDLQRERDTNQSAMSAGEFQRRNEVNRLISLAQTHIEDAAMWGVKAVTKQVSK